MTESLPTPLVPAGLVLRNFEYMPVDVVRLRDSRFSAEVSAEAFRCGVLLWCASWHQVPAGSLPDDDLLLAGYAGFGRATREWMKHRAGALHGWVKCSDGRFYHPVVCEKAIEAQGARDLQAYKTECARIKKAAQRGKVEPNYPTFDQWLNHKAETGSARWDAESSCNVPNDVPETSSASPEMSRSKGREGKGREGISNTGTSYSAAHTKNHERAAAIASALRGYGYQVDSDSLEVTQLVAMAATDGEIAEACTKAKGFFRTKPLAWVVSRIDGRRNDASRHGQQSVQSATPAPVDPAIVAKQAADTRLQNALIEARQLADYGHIKPEERQQREREARAKHAAAVAALEAAA